MILSQGKSYNGTIMSMDLFYWYPSRSLLLIALLGTLSSLADQSVLITALRLHDEKRPEKWHAINKVLRRDSAHLY